MKKLVLLFGWIGSLTLAVAEPQTYDFKDPKGVNNVVFKTDAPLESINGTANGVSGTITFDPLKPGDLKGKIMVAAASLHVGNPTMKEHLHGSKWMDVAKYPQIIFEAESVEGAATAGNSTVARVNGSMTMKGVTKKITVPVKLTFLKDKLQERLPNLKGDLLVLRAEFKVKRSDFGINAGSAEDKVSDEIELSLSLAGQAPR